MSIVSGTGTTLTCEDMTSDGVMVFPEGTTAPYTNCASVRTLVFPSSLKIISNLKHLPALTTLVFNLDGSSTSTELQVFKQGHGINMSHGAHNLHGFFTNVSAGSHTVTIQVRNSTSSTTAIMNYFDDANNGDNIFVLYK